MSYPRDIDPNIVIFMQPVGIRDFQLDADPIVFPTVAEEIHVRSSDSYDGRYRQATGEIHGHAEPKRQNTYISDPKSAGGRQFVVESGAWYEDYQTDYSGVYGIIQQDNTKDVSYAVHSATTTSGIENCTMWVGRGALPIVDASYQFTPSNTYLYIYLAWGQKVDFRIALEYRRPMRIDRTQDNWVTFEKCAVSASNADTDRFFSTKTHKCPIDVFVDRDNNQLVVELGDGKELVTTPYNPPEWMAGVDFNVLPSVGKIRVSGKNGTCSFEYYPKRYQPIIAKIRKDIGNSGHPRSSDASIVVNNKATADPTLTVDYTVTPNGPIHEVDIQIGRPDIGDGSGSYDAPRLVDATMIIPPVWTSLTYGPGQNGGFYPKDIVTEYWQMFDDNTNTLSSGGNLILDNFQGDYTNIRGNLAVDIWGTAGGRYFKLFTGIAGCGPGMTLFTVDTLGRISCPIFDFSEKMKHPIGQRLILDRMCIYNAIQLLATLGGIHPMYLERIPKYIPPGCSGEAPYGPAGIDCPYPVLSSGNGTHARHEYGPEVHGWDILQILIQDQGTTDFFGTTSVPWYTGFDIDGQLRAEPFDPGNLVPVVFFSEYDPTGLAQIQDININWSTGQMRSQVDFLGLQPWTNALQHYHVEQSQTVKTAIGYPSRWIERGARYSDEYLVNAAKNGARMASLQQMSGHITNTWIPYITAGQRCLVYDRKTLGFVLDAYIKRVSATIGMRDLSGQSGKIDCNAHYEIRAVANTPHIIGI